MAKKIFTWKLCSDSLIPVLKVLLSDLAKHSGQVEELKSTLRKLIADSPDSPEVDSWRQQLLEIGM